MHGAREGEGGKRGRHMLHSPTTTPVAAAADDSKHDSGDFFVKDKRKIQVGDCALFRSGNAPPFIGIIRWFTTVKENYLKLGVNWLYRPADVKLAKGISLEAAPNEVFYSFHQDEIPAASLLHPCKVAFLRKGVELPSGISSFVCRRVYDIEHKCLWWLTDQDYINERQEEVDKLLDRTRLEMHALQSGGRSPKHLNGPTSTQQLKSGSDSVQNSGTSFPPQVKGKKRERGDQVTEPIKREHITKIDDGDPASLRLNSMIKAEIAKITEKGGLVNIEGVDKLVHLMQLDRSEKKIDLAGRVLLADVIAATDGSDCLGRFIQLRGLPVLDDWLQQAHKGRAGDGSSPKESDKTVEDLLLSLLRALDKLPVNINALQTCNIGKSVNHLRSHKNLDIQKKARSLIDSWKKRVDAEMKINDAKSVGSCNAVSWPTKQGFPEVPHGGNRRAGSSDPIMRSSAIQPSTCKAQPSKPGHSDSSMKSLSATPGPSKLPSTSPTPTAMSSKESLNKATGGSGAPEFPPMTIKEEKSSNFGQSQNNNQSGLSDHAKIMGPSWKEDSKSSNAGLSNANKITGASSRHRRSSNGLIVTTSSGVLRDSNMVKPGSVNRTATTDKVSQSGLACERILDMPTADHGNNHRLIVRLPNPGRSPARNASGGPTEDPLTVGARASSPGDTNKDDHIDHKIKVRADSCQPNVDAESCHCNDIKEELIGSDEVDRSQGGSPYEEHCRSADETGKTSDASRAACSPSGNEKEVFLSESKTGNSFSSIYALVESCAKFSEASASLTAGDDIGMNLLASVAAGEMCTSKLVSPAGSPRSSPAAEEPCSGNSGVKLSDDLAQSYSQPNDTMDIESENHVNNVVHMTVKEDLQETGDSYLGDDKTIASLQESKLAGEQSEQQSVSSTSLHRGADPGVKSEGKLQEEKADGSLSASTSPAKMKGEAEGKPQDKQKATGQMTDSPTDCKSQVRSPSLDENKVITSSWVKLEGCDGCNVDNISSDRKTEVVADESLVFPPSNMGVQKQNVADEGLNGDACVTPAVVDREANDRNSDAVVASSAMENVVCPEGAGETKAEKASNAGLKSHMQPSDGEVKEKPCSASSTVDDQAGSVLCSSKVEEGLETKEALAHEPAGSTNHKESSVIPIHETEEHEKASGSVSGPDSQERDNHAYSSVATLAILAESDISSKIDFDLNEGLPGVDGNHGEPVTSGAPLCSSAIHLHSLSPFSAPMLNGMPAPITVAAPAKGPFVPRENLLKSKAEPGWKGSAATSAFRPAEPRKVLEMSLNTCDVPLSDMTTGKQVRPALDIDLNVPDERVLEDMASQTCTQAAGSESEAISKRETPIRMTGGLDLDLNKVDEGTENGQLITNSSQKIEVTLIPIRSVPGEFPDGESSISRDFDLNGPGLDEVGVEPAIRSQHGKSSGVPLLPPFAGLRMSNSELGSMSSWFPRKSYPAVSIPPFLPDRGEQPYPIIPTAPGSQMVLGPATAGRTFAGDIYRGPVLSSSPAMAFSHATAFPYAGFSFGSPFPLVSTSILGSSTTYVDPSSGGNQCFSTIPSQLVAPMGAVSSSYPRPYIISLPEGSSIGGSESSQKWSRPGLDLNAGPGGADVEGRDDRLASATRQFSVATSQAFADDQARIYHVGGGGLKRKEPDGGWDAERYPYKQPSWQ